MFFVSWDQKSSTVGLESHPLSFQANRCQIVTRTEIYVQTGKGFEGEKKRERKKVRNKKQTKKGRKEGKKDKEGKAR